MEQELLYEIHSIMAATAIGFCRIAPTFYLLPFFASGNIPAVVRHPVIILLSFALVQHFHYELLTLNKYSLDCKQRNSYRVIDWMFVGISVLDFSRNW
ncbi:flagellar biosynthetic protein FliR [Escherichia albertii]|nr:flagellar biosynthetic protein FliR [Escherichia albertii]